MSKKRARKPRMRKAYLAIIAGIAVLAITLTAYLVLHQAPSGSESTGEKVDLAELYISGSWTFTCINETCDIMIRVTNTGNASVELRALSILAVLGGSPEMVGSVVINETLEPGETKTIHRQLAGVTAEKLKTLLDYIFQGYVIDLYAYLGTSIGRVLLELHYIPA
ncbi:MAG: hypothetical protein QXJ84_04885 [Desulfurococcaceae archaeon]